MKLVGRKQELDHISRMLGLNRNILVEGPVGVGKTFLVREALKKLNRQFERIDGDTRYTEQKLTGWFDPPVVLKKGYTKDCFIPGPLLTAMQKGRVLFINELNRMPEAVQNILLPAMDEFEVVVPKLGVVKAKEGFCVVATQNPREFTATHSLSEALLDRFEWIFLGYQSEEEERQILKNEVGSCREIDRIVSLVRATRNHASIKRGASIRAGIAIAKLLDSGIEFQSACLLALPSRLEMITPDENAEQVLLDLLQGLQPAKKKA